MAEGRGSRRWLAPEVVQASPMDCGPAGLQVMDPGSGRSWVEVESFRRSLYVHGMDLPAELWRRFAGSRNAAAVLADLLRGLGHRRARARVAEALEDPGWRAIAALEATA